MASAFATSTPIAAYSFDEGTGSTLTDSTGNHNGTISGAAWTTGKYGYALSFDGTDDLVSIGDAAELDLTGDFTIEAWVKPENFNAGAAIFKGQQPGGDITGYGLGAESNTGKPRGFVADSNRFLFATNPNPLTAGQWVHLALTSDGTTMNLYVDGELSKSNPAIPVGDTNGPLEIGHAGYAVGYFRGLIDEVRIYDEMLTDTQVATDRDSAVSLDPQPIAAYSFDEGSGTTLEDSAGSHDGTISGATWTTGKYGSALSFDGRDDLVSIPDAAELDLTDSFTLEAWMKPEDLRSGSISKGNSGDITGYALGVDSGTGKPRGFVANANDYRFATGPAPLTANQWVHLALTSDGTTMRLYLDGELEQSAAAIPVGATDGPLQFGYVGYAVGYFRGLIDEVRIYDEVLTDSQLQVDQDSRIETPAPIEVTTISLDTGARSEQVAALPITDPQDPDQEATVYSLAVPSIAEGEVLRATANLELTNDQIYDTTDSVKLVLGSDPDNAAGEIVVPYSSVTHTPEMRHWTFPISGAYRADSNLGTQYLKVIAKATSPSAGTNDTLTVQQNFGSLTAVRSTPSTGPISQPTHRLQPQIDPPLIQLIDTLPVDSGWHRVMTRRVEGLTANDILDLAGQVEVNNPSSATVKLETKISMTTSPSASAYPTASPEIAERLGPDMPTARTIHSAKIKVSDPTERYFNLLVKAIPVSGTPLELEVASGSATLDVLRHEDSPGDPSADLGEGTLVEQRAGFQTPGLTEIPYAVPGGSQKRVVASVALYGGVWKDEIINARGILTGSMNGTSEVTQVLTRLILADSPTETEGVTIGAFSGDKVPPSAQTHTSVKEGVYVMPSAEPVAKYINFVVYASQANPSGSMLVDDASVYLTRSKPTAPLDENFEQGLDALYRHEYTGPLSMSSDVAREGSHSMLADLDFSRNIVRGNLGNLRVQANVPDIRGNGGYYGTDRWYGFSTYFDKNFNLGPDVARFEGLIDEVRLYNQPLSTSEIADDMAGSYTQTPTPVAAYGFNEGSGLTARDSTGSHNGSIEGAAWTSSGKIGSALYFDGSNALVSVEDSPDLDLTEAFTLEAWIRPQNEISVWSPIISKAKSEAEQGYRLVAETYPDASVNNPNGWEAGRPAGLIADEQRLTTVKDSELLPMDTWSHIALVYNGSDLRLYVDGTEVAKNEGATIVANDSDLTIGGSDVPGGGSAVLATVFAQMHGTDEDWGIQDLGFDCPTQVPIIFSAVRLLNAPQLIQGGLVENPADLPTPNSPEEYIGLVLEGGEYSDGATCAIEPNQAIILAQFERERWYDFVLHTHWTPTSLPGGESVTEVWVDGEQIVGNGSYPISHPNMVWYGAPSLHSTEASFNFGIYRHISALQPKSKLYIDAVRTGNSYAEVVPGQ